MKKDRKLSLVVKIGTFIGLIVLICNIGQFFFISYDLKKEITKDKLAEFTHLAQTYVKAIENKIECYNEALDFYTNADIVQTGDIVAIGKWLRQHENVRDNDFDYVMVVGPNGKTYSDIGKSTNVTERPYFKAIMKEGKTEFIGDPVFSKTTGQTVVHIAKALQVNGKTFAMVAGVVNVNNITEIMDSVKIGENGYGWLLASDGLCISHPEKDFVMKKNFITGLSEGF
ncbi:MAG: cache domain-containing protein, partial [Treponemataceae bacterium]|nr:cache domain-containing protein [Treponemataceae bacterium]